MDYCMNCKHWCGNRERAKEALESLDSRNVWTFAECNMSSEWAYLEGPGGPSASVQVGADFCCPYWVEI